MTNYQIYQEQKINKTDIWILFLLLGWSYGSMGKMGKQIFFYITLGGAGLWTLYRLFTLNKAIRNHNRDIAIKSGLTDDEMFRMGLTY